MTTTVQWLGSAAAAIVVAVGATVAVCLGHIGEATYIAIVGPIAGVYVGAGIHAQGVATTAGQGPNAGTTPP